MYGTILPDDDLAGMRRGGQQVFHRAALAFARDGQAGDDDHGHGQHHAHEPGHDVVLADAFGIVMRVGDQIERRRARLQAGERTGQIAVDAPSAPADCTAAVAKPTADGSVASASSSRSGFSPRRSLREKSTGTVRANCTWPSASNCCDFRRAMRLARDVEIAAVAQAPDERA